jgi:hypothetical protein
VDDLIGVVGAGAAFQSGEQLVLANLEFQHRIDAGVAGCERAGYRLRRLNRAWVAVKDERSATKALVKSDGTRSPASR